jgi:hypothetical protein
MCRFSVKFGLKNIMVDNWRKWMMSRNWTIDEASADLLSLLEAARTSSQYIVAPDGRFELSFRQTGGKSLDNILDKEGPLKPGDTDEFL